MLDKQQKITQLAFYLGIGLTCLLHACSNNKPNELETNIPSASTDFVEPIVVDSLLLTQLEYSYLNHTFLYNYRDSASNGSEYNEDDSFVETKLDINGDGVEDYFVLYDDFHHVAGAFFDGFSGAKIPVKSDFMENQLFWNRPYPNERADGLIVSVTDVDCEDGQSDLQVIYHSGSPPGLTHLGAYLEIYHYNADSGAVNLIFSEVISREWAVYESNGTNETIHYTFNFIDILHTQRACLDHIKVIEGKPTKRRDVWKYSEIEQKKEGRESQFIYNRDIQKFEPLGN